VRDAMGLVLWRLNGQVRVGVTFNVCKGYDLEKRVRMCTDTEQDVPLSSGAGTAEDCAEFSSNEFSMTLNEIARRSDVSSATV